MVRNGPSCLDYTEPSSGISPCLVALKVGVPIVWHSTSSLSVGIPFLSALLLSWIIQEFPGGSRAWLCTVTSWPFLSCAILRVPSLTPCVTYTIPSHAACSSHTAPQPMPALALMPAWKELWDRSGQKQAMLGEAGCSTSCDRIWPCSWRPRGAGSSLTMIQRTHPSGKGPWAYLGYLWPLNLKVTLFLKMNIFGSKDW